MSRNSWFFLPPGDSAYWWIHGPATESGEPCTRYAETFQASCEARSSTSQYPISSPLIVLLILFQNFSLYEDIEAGAEFFFSEEDYLSPEELNGTPRRAIRESPKRRNGKIRIKIVKEYTIKTESSPSPSKIPSPEPTVPEPSMSASDLRRQPRRSAASSIKSYAIPDSDDEEIADVEDKLSEQLHANARKRKVESNLQKWIKHLGVLYKEEQKKVCVLWLLTLVFT